VALYHIQLPEGMLLTIEITDNPVHFSISFPGGMSVHFDHSAAGDRVDVDAGLKNDHDAATMINRVSSSPGGPVIVYSDPGGSM
jgi:hypothetical protein